MFHLCRLQLMIVALSVHLGLCLMFYPNETNIKYTSRAIMSVIRPAYNKLLIKDCSHGAVSHLHLYMTIDLDTLQKIRTTVRFIGVTYTVHIPAFQA